MQFVPLFIATLGIPYGTHIFSFSLASVCMSPKLEVMKMKKMSGIGGVVAILMLIQYADAQTIHNVGDNLGWRVPQNNSTYQNWASSNNFAVGDTLRFDFDSDRHNVIQVSEPSYRSCNSSNPIQGPWTSGPASIILNTTGPHYYICGVGQHCTNGQRLAINVSGSSSALPPSTAAPPPPSSSSAPTSIPLLFLFSAFIIMAF